MHGIFISYRREDAAGYAGRLYDRLATHFGAERVFMDVEEIEPGADFVDAIARAVGSCEVLIVIIGNEWLAVDSAGHRRLDDPADFVRIETATALARGIRVVPVLVDGAVVPRADQLPVQLVPLTRRQAVELSHKQWEATTSELIRTLEKILKKDQARVAKTSPAEPMPEVEPQQSGPQPIGERHIDRRLWGIGAVIVLVAASALLYLTQPWREDTKQPPPPAALRVTPAQVEFAEQPLRVASAASVVTLANDGGAPLRVRSVKIEGPNAAEFALDDSQCSARELGPGETCAIKVAFLPRASGMRAATLAITAEGTGTSPSISLQGRGAESVAAVATPPVDKPAPAPAARPTSPPEAKPEVATAPAKTLPSPPAQLVTVPNLAGKSRRDAIAELENAGLQVRVVEDKTDSSVSGAIESVVSQLPKGGEQLKAGGRVTLYVAAAAPSPAAAPAPAPAAAPTLATNFPRVGDTWQYRVRSMWKNVEERTYVHQVTAVSPREVRETMADVASGGNASDSKSFGADPSFVDWRGKGYYFFEFNPFLQVFGALQPDTAWKSLAIPYEDPFYTNWYSQGRVAGWETVSVPAGTFKALRVELNSSRPTRAGATMQEPQRVRYVIWYASDAKRTIKQVRTIYAATGSRLDEQTYELVKYVVQ